MDHTPHNHGKGHDHSHHHEHEEEHDHGHEHPAGPVEYIRLGVLAIVILASLTGWWKNFMDRDWLALAATLVGSFPIVAEAWENLRKRRMTMELSMTLALLGALFIGQLSPIIAALIHVGSELAFILNSARLFRLKSASSACDERLKTDRS